MNICILSGNITKIYDNSPSHIKIYIADNYKDKVSFIPVLLFGNNMMWAQKYFEVGDHVSITGIVGNYRDNNNVERVSIIAHQIRFEGYKNPKKVMRSQQAQYQQEQYQRNVPTDYGMNRGFQQQAQHPTEEHMGYIQYDFAGYQPPIEQQNEPMLYQPPHEKQKEIEQFFKEVDEIKNINEPQKEKGNDDKRNN